jgi:8-oxo-dGTP pyrophosphatase MutT (NUDIX family)
LDFTSLKKTFSEAFLRELPGQNAQYKMVPKGRSRVDFITLDETKVKKAAVLALIINDRGTPKIILTLRSEYEGVHSGQISFPGGKREKEDHNFTSTALREAEEEIGIKRDKVEVLGGLTPIYIPPSNFLVYPYLGFYNGARQFTRQESEVQKIIPVDFNVFNDSSIVKDKELVSRSWKMKVPTYQIDGYTVWGATAMILSEIKEMVW